MLRCYITLKTIKPTTKHSNVMLQTSISQKQQIATMPANLANIFHLSISLFLLRVTGEVARADPS